ncbi:hypothetical protein ACFLTP_06255 [Chloroflexota bacterium]
MKKETRQKKVISKKNRWFHLALKNEAGFVLTWVLLLVMISGIVLSPFLLFMITGLQSTHSYADAMAEFYAADSGIEDASYRITREYNEATTLNGDITAISDVVTVVSTDRFPLSGVASIENELIYYTGKTATTFTGCTRGYDSTTPAGYSSGTSLSVELPQEPRDSWHYSITGTVEDINKKQVDVTIERLWILEDLEGTTKLSALIDENDDEIPVISTDTFPQTGIIRINNELIQYDSKTSTTFNVTVGGRGYDGTIPIVHDTNVSVHLDSVPLLSNDLKVIGQVIDDAVTTTLATNISDNDDTIEVASTDGFPLVSDSLPSLILIDDEMIQYVAIDRSDDELTVYDDPSTPGVVDGRGVYNTTPASHDVPASVTTKILTYQIDLTYNNSRGDIDVSRIGVWLPAGFSYVPGSSNLTTALGGPITESTDDQIPADPDVNSGTTFFPAADATNPSVFAVEDELIQYTDIDLVDDEFNDCTRGLADTTAMAHVTGTPISAEPVQIAHHGGKALVWNFDPVFDFTDLPRLAPAGGGNQPRDEFPVKRTVTFKFSPAQLPKGIFPWIRTGNTDLFFVWDDSAATYKITSTATDTTTTTQTTLHSYLNASKLTGRVAQVFGDARAIGNSVIRGDPVNRDELINESSAFIDNDHDNEIPEGAKVESAYLYWSGWRSEPTDISSYTTEELTLNVNQAVFNGVPITAERVQILPNDYSGSPHGWSFSSFKDVTSMLEPEPSVDIILSSAVSTESVTIYDDGALGDLDIEITADNGNLDDMTINVDGIITTIPPGQSRDIDITSPETGVLSPGSTAGSYDATILVTGSWDEGIVDGSGVDNESINGPWRGGPDFIDVTLATTIISPEATITKITTLAEVDITTPDTNTGDIDVDGTTIAPGEMESFTYSADPSDTVTGNTNDQLTVTCTDGMVKVEWGPNSVVIGKPGSQMTNGEYTLGLLGANPFVTADDLDDEWSHAGWSLIVIYSHPDEDAHQLFLYDDLTYVSNYANNFPDGYLEFDISGFLAPEDFTGILTCFIGEGDPHYTGEYIELNGYRLPRPGDPYDDPPGLNPQDNVWNGQSSVPGIDAGEGTGLDIDAFTIENPVVNEGDTSATLTLDSGIEIWNIIYIFLSFDTIPVGEATGSPVGVVSFGFGSG